MTVAQDETRLRVKGERVTSVDGRAFRWRWVIEQDGMVVARGTRSFACEQDAEDAARETIQGLAQYAEMDRRRTAAEKLRAFVKRQRSTRRWR